MTSTASQLLDTAHDLVQARGFNAFSYKDLAEAVGIRTASIHYHFPSKADLGAALIGRYIDRLEDTLASIEASKRSARARLIAFFDLYKATEAEGAICLCGSLASDLETLTPEVRTQVQAYLVRSETWLAAQLKDGETSGAFTLPGRPRDLAATLLASLQGGLILARARGTTKVIATIQRGFLASLEAA